MLRDEYDNSNIEKCNIYHSYLFEKECEINKMNYELFKKLRSTMK